MEVVKGNRALFLALAWLVLSDQILRSGAAETTSGGQLTYSSTELLQLRHTGLPPLAGLWSDVPREILISPDAGDRQWRKPRKRGRKGGIRQRIRRANKLPLPPMILCNSCSLKNKLDNLRQYVGACCEFRTSAVLAFTETWFGDDVPDNFIQIDGFSHVRLDRDANSGKVQYALIPRKISPLGDK
ncbi:hypothetical protein SRHO_G00242650 [Serrasalmus rhombeus]